MKVVALLLLLPAIAAVHLSDSVLRQVYAVMQEISTHSWENGTKAEAMTEYTYPSHSVFSPTQPINPIPNGNIDDIILIAQTTLQNRPALGTASSVQNHTSGSLLDDGAAGDPASLGVAVLMANQSMGSAVVNGVGYGQAGEEELRYLLEDVPRTSTGAISHRANEAQYWADSVYMVPPFLAYYAALTNNLTLAKEAHNQISLYRNALRQPSGLWNHMAAGPGGDYNIWTTGNAWVAAGMLRVWASFYWSSFKGDLTAEMGDLEGWTDEILGACAAYLTPNGLFRNYMTDNTSFEETSASAMIAAAGFRLSTLNLTNAHVNLSSTLLSAVSNHINSSGYLGQVVDPIGFSDQGTISPEGQSFVILAYAAYTDWVALGSPGSTSGGKDPLGSDSGAMGRVSLVGGRRGVGLGLGLMGVLGGMLLL